MKAGEMRQHGAGAGMGQVADVPCRPSRHAEDVAAARQATIDGVRPATATAGNCEPRQLILLEEL
jgi:hypothetical protein